MALLQRACQLQKDELKEARSVGENRNGLKSEKDGNDDDRAFEG